MPSSEIKPWVAAYVEEYLIERTQNPNSSIGGNVNYLNPDPSAGVSKKDMEQWGNDVVAQAEVSGLIFGEGKHKHYHGTNQGVRKHLNSLLLCQKTINGNGANDEKTIYVDRFGFYNFSSFCLR